MKPINRVQELLLSLMREASFNGFDGDQVADALIEHRDLWRAVLFDHDRLIKLRDLPAGHWNVDTLWVLPENGREDDLERLARAWGADEVDWVGGEKACVLLGSYSPAGREKRRTILRCWWD